MSARTAGSPTGSSASIAIDGDLSIATRDGEVRLATSGGAPHLELPARTSLGFSTGLKAAWRHRKRWAPVLRRLDPPLTIARGGRPLLQVGREVRGNWFLRALGIQNVRVRKGILQRRG